MISHRELFTLTVALLFFSLLPCIHLRPYHQFRDPTLIAFQFPLERWYNVPQPVRLQFYDHNDAASDELYGDGARPAWWSFTVACLIAYLTVMANGGGISLLIQQFLPLACGFGFVMFVSTLIAVPFDFWSQNRFRVSTRGLLLLVAIIVGALAFLASRR